VGEGGGLCLVVWGRGGCGVLNEKGLIIRGVGCWKFEEKKKRRDLGEKKRGLMRKMKSSGKDILVLDRGKKAN